MATLPCDHNFPSPPQFSTLSPPHPRFYNNLCAPCQLNLLITMLLSPLNGTIVFCRKESGNHFLQNLVTFSERNKILLIKEMRNKLEIYDNYYDKWFFFPKESKHLYFINNTFFRFYAMNFSHIITQLSIFYLFSKHCETKNKREGIVRI